MVVDCSGFLPLSSSDVMTSSTAACTAGTAPTDDLCQQPRLTNSAMMNAAPQVRFNPFLLLTLCYTHTCSKATLLPTPSRLRCCLDLFAVFYSASCV